LSNRCAAPRPPRNLEAIAFGVVCADANFASSNRRFSGSCRHHEEHLRFCRRWDTAGSFLQPRHPLPHTAGAVVSCASSRSDWRNSSRKDRSADCSPTNAQQGRSRPADIPGPWRYTPRQRNADCWRPGSWDISILFALERVIALSKNPRLKARPKRSSAKGQPVAGSLAKNNSTTKLPLRFPPGRRGRALSIAVAYPLVYRSVILRILDVDSPALLRDRPPAGSGGFFRVSGHRELVAIN